MPLACGGAGPARGEGAAFGQPQWNPGTAAIRCNVCCRSLARYDAEPTPLPAERRLLLEQLEAFHAEVWQRLS
jgi:hypothetical protein